MKKAIFAVCDPEKEYAHNFMEYLNQKQSHPYEIQAFSSVDTLTEYAKKHHIEILLVSDKAMCHRVRELDVGKLMILSEGVHSPQLDQYPSVYKYQSSDNVIREVMNCYGEETVLTGERIQRPLKVLGVYSPLGRVLKTSFALTLGQILAKQKAVLYLSLEEYSALKIMMDTEFEKNLSDLLYYIRQGYTNFAHLLGGMVLTCNNMDYLPPVQFSMDIRGTSMEQWENLVQAIAAYSSYEVLIVDVGNGLEDLGSFFNCCHKIYMPVQEDWVSREKIRQFERTLQLSGQEELIQKIEKLHLPYHGLKKEGGNYIDQLVWSALGDYVRELLRKEKL